MPVLLILPHLEIVTWGEKEDDKIENCQDLKREIMKLWNLSRVEVIHVVVGALGSASKKIGRYLEKLGVDIWIGLLQKTALLEKQEF